MIETRRLENVVIFIQTVLSFVLSKKCIIEIKNGIMKDVDVSLKYIIFLENIIFGIQLHLVANMVNI